MTTAGNREIPMGEFVRVERAGAVATIWIDRQPKMNTMTVAMRNEFPGLVQASATDRLRARDSQDGLG